MYTIREILVGTTNWDGSKLYGSEKHYKNWKTLTKSLHNGGYTTMWCGKGSDLFKNNVLLGNIWAFSEYDGGDTPVNKMTLRKFISASKGGET